MLVMLTKKILPLALAHHPSPFSPRNHDHQYALKRRVCDGIHRISLPFRAPARWDTKAEVDMYKRKLVQERNYISRKLASTSQIQTDDLILCIGMEKILSINVCKEVKRRQKQHVLSILEEQARQELCNVVDVEALSRLSQNNSKWTNNRSHTLSWLMVIGEKFDG